MCSLIEASGSNYLLCDAVKTAECSVIETGYRQSTQFQIVLDSVAYRWKEALTPAAITKVNIESALISACFHRLAYGESYPDQCHPDTGYLRTTSLEGFWVAGRAIHHKLGRNSL